MSEKTQISCNGLGRLVGLGGIATGPKPLAGWLKHIPVDAVHHVEYLARRARYGAQHPSLLYNMLTLACWRLAVTGPPQNEHCGGSFWDLDFLEVHNHVTEFAAFSEPPSLKTMHKVKAAAQDGGNLVHQLCPCSHSATHPTKSPRTVHRICQQIQVQVNEAQQEQANLKCRAEQQLEVDTTCKPRKRCRSPLRPHVVLEVYISYIHRHQGANGLFDGKSKLPQPKCLEWTIWLHSADTQLVKVGDETTIDYGYRYRIYIRRIREGLHDKKAWVIGLLQYWDRILFPNADKSREHDATGNEEVDDDEDVDDIFGQAPSAAERTVPQIASPPQDNHKDDFQSRSSSPSPPPHSRHFSTSSPQLSSSSHPRSSAQPSNPLRTTSWTPTIPPPASAVRHPPVPPMGPSRQFSS
ncbi:hypothetical protein B0H10DRAFT_2200430 [Mycena sp. CBHHK59/15]|nr:hypothetical protein B0H10DRAFT_2200430 [Mycena sp. CBHHK59/15]